MNNKKKQKFFLGFFLIVFILIVSANIVLINILPIKTTAASQSNIEFSITKSKAIKVLRDTFDGDTADFSLGGNAGLESIKDMTLEKSNYGKIIFTEPINLTEDTKKITEDELYSREIDLDNNIIISNNLIEINTENLPSLEKPATLYLYGLAFDNPRILRNNEVCPSSICQIIDYFNGILKFSVTGFTSYSAEETPSVEEEVDGGGREGCTYNWACTDWRPSICPETGMQTRTCTNQGTCTDIIGKPNETRTCIPGQIPEEVLFDVEVSVITKEVSAGDEIRAEIELLKIAGEKVDVNVYYSIKDQFNNTITTKYEIIAVETKTSFIGQLTIPSKVKPGTYTFHVKAIYKEQSWEASESFEVIKKPIGISTPVILGILILMLLIFIIILYYVYKRIKGLTNLLKKVTEEDLIRGGYIKKIKRSK